MTTQEAAQNRVGPKFTQFNERNGMPNNMRGLPSHAVEDLMAQEGLNSSALVQLRLAFCDLFTRPPQWWLSLSDSEQAARVGEFVPSPPPGFDQRAGEFEYTDDQRFFEAMVVGYLVCQRGLPALTNMGLPLGDKNRLELIARLSPYQPKDTPAHIQQAIDHSVAVQAELKAQAEARKLAKTAQDQPAPIPSEGEIINNASLNMAVKLEHLPASFNYGELLHNSQADDIKITPIVLGLDEAEALPLNSGNSLASYDASAPVISLEPAATYALSGAANQPELGLIEAEVGSVDLVIESEGNDEVDLSDDDLSAVKHVTLLDTARVRMTLSQYEAIGYFNFRHEDQPGFSIQVEITDTAVIYGAKDVGRVSMPEGVRLILSGSAERDFTDHDLSRVKEVLLRGTSKIRMTAAQYAAIGYANFFSEEGTTCRIEALDTGGLVEVYSTNHPLVSLNSEGWADATGTGALIGAGTPATLTTPQLVEALPVSAALAAAVMDDVCQGNQAREMFSGAYFKVYWHLRQEGATNHFSTVGGQVILDARSYNADLIRVTCEDPLSKRFLFTAVVDKAALADFALWLARLFTKQWIAAMVLTPNNPTLAALLNEKTTVIETLGYPLTDAYFELPHVVHALTKVEVGLGIGQLQSANVCAAGYVEGYGSVNPTRLHGVPVDLVNGVQQSAPSPDVNLTFAPSSGALIGSLVFASSPTLTGQPGAGTPWFEQEVAALRQRVNAFVEREVEDFKIRVTATATQQAA